MNDLLLAFVEVARTGSVAKAALHTHITNSALLKKIDHLEDEVGTKLFIRTHQGMTLTKAGQSFLTDSELLLNYYQNAVAKARNIKHMRPKKIIRLGSSLIAPALYLKPFLNEKIKEKFVFDLVPLTTTMATANIVFENLGKYVDLMADIYDRSLLSRYGCAAKKICDLSCQIACLPGNALLKKQSLKLSDLRGQVVNFFYPVENEISHQWQVTLTKAGLKTHHWSYLSAEMFNYAANHNQLVVTTDFWHELAPFFEILPVKLSVKISYGFIYKKPATKDIKQLLEMC